ncbi:hypothetical protein OEZ85_007571 [Tetradesmus obliquus]|uniref:Uncharacterized protein n=1 Tax=Tetradesmus obliquus TaxID=3088 RepID=A0ABY8TGM9_TETOB|nr:hypothetical protein OEZ85_007571 [Tetradesmus obliquus]
MATPDTANPVSQVLNTAVAAAGDVPEQLQEGLMSAQAALTQMLRGYLGQFQGYIGESGELALAAVLGTADAAASGKEGVLTKREIIEKDMMAALSKALASRLTHLASLVPADGSSLSDEDAAAAEAAVKAALQAELDRLVQVPFGVPLLHEIGRAYCRVSDSWRGNLLVQGLRNVADNISHKVSAVTGAVSLGFMSQTMQATGEAAAAAAEDKAALAEQGAYPEAAEAAGSSGSGFKSPLLQPVIPEPAPGATSSEAGTAAAAALGSATAQALWLESHLADVINALWRLLTHDLDRVLRGAADGALRQLRDVERSEDEKTVVSVQQAAWVLGIMGGIFKGALRPFAPANASSYSAAAAAMSHGSLALAAATALTREGGTDAVLPLDSFGVQQQGKVPASKEAGKMAQQAAEAAGTQLQQASKEAAAQLEGAGEAAATLLPAAAGNLAEQAASIRDQTAPALGLAGAAAGASLATASEQAAAAAAAAAGQVAADLPGMAYRLVEGHLKPAAAAAAEALPGMAQQLGEQSIKEQGAILAAGLATTAANLGAGTQGDDGVLSAAGVAVAALPDAVAEVNREVVLPGLAAVAGDITTLAKGAEQQATLVLSLLPASCRSADPQLLPGLRGELLYMARIIEHPVSSARAALESADLPGRAEQLQETLLPAAEEVAGIVESGVASAAPAIGQQLQEAGQLLSQAGQEGAGQLLDVSEEAAAGVSSQAQQLAQKLEPAAEQAGEVLVGAAEQAAAAAEGGGEQLAEGLKAAGHTLGEAAAATSAHAAQALAAAADATATTASAAATAAQQQEQQQQGFAAAGKAAAQAVAAAASGADKGLQEAAGQVAEVGHSGVEAGREAAEKVVSGSAADAAQKLSGSSDKAAAAITSAAAGLRDAASTAAAGTDASETGASTDAAAAAAGKAAGVVEHAGEKLAGAAEGVGDVLAATAQEAAAAAGDAAEHLQDSAKQAADSVAAAAKQQGLQEGAQKGLEEAPAAAKAAISGIVEGVKGAGGEQKVMQAGDELQKAGQSLQQGLKAAAGQLAGAVLPASLTNEQGLRAAAGQLADAVLPSSLTKGQKSDAAVDSATEEKSEQQGGKESYVPVVAAKIEEAVAGAGKQGEGEWQVVGKGGKPLHEAQQEGKVLAGQAAAVGTAVAAEAPAGSNE